MAKVTCIVLFIVAISLRSIQADDSNDSEPDIDLDQIVMECSEKFDIPFPQIPAALRAANAHALKPCFWSCCFMKVGVINSKGQYDVDFTLDLAKKMLGRQDEKKVEATVKDCESVNDAPVSDGNAGCERSLLLATCLLDNCKKNFPEIFGH
ncbi:hypothetical protein HF086_015976 [Spodoptera exigua]|uniref:Uncharacterized protein n=1 Tax=Spodoptera exigua TaxID=7107 RepID=A0A922SCE4_SPOEX|nr:hypothetical protein HF086_015976 [Spodoptera exigua]